MSTQAIPAVGAQYLGFQVAEEEYAIEILRVREILEYDTLTRLPNTPPSVRGVFNLRGRVVPVLDLAVKLGRDASPITKRSCVVVVEAHFAGRPTVMGVLADAVSEVLHLPASELEPPPAFGARVGADCLLGLGRAGRRLVLVLDIDKLLATDRAEGAPLR